MSKQLFNIFFLSEKKQHYFLLKNNMQPTQVNWIHGNVSTDFSRLFNLALTESSSEFVIMIGEQVYPTPSDIDYVVGKLQEGFGFISLAGFSFIALNRSIIRKIGFMDERYQDCEWCNIDFLIRLGQHNIPVAFHNNVIHFPVKTASNEDIGKRHFDAKWKIDDVKITRLLPEENYEYNIGPYIDFQLLDGKNTSWIPNTAFGPAYSLGIQNSLI